MPLTCKERLHWRKIRINLLDCWSRGADDRRHPESHTNWGLHYHEQLEYRVFTHAILSSIRHLPEMRPLEAYLVVIGAGIPLQLIRGRRDQPPFRDIERFICAIPTTEDAGHIPHLEHPEAVKPQGPYLRPLFAIGFINKESPQDFAGSCFLFALSDLRQ